MENFFTFVRLEKEKNTNKELINCVYKRVNNYSATDNIETIIAKMKDPDIHPAFSDSEIIDEIMKIANISFSEAEIKYQTFIEMHEIRLRDGKRIPDGTETGVRLSFTQDSSNIAVEIQSVNDYQTFERVIIFLKSLIHIYKQPELLKNKKINKVELKDELKGEDEEPEIQNIEDVIQPAEIEGPPSSDSDSDEKEDKSSESESDGEDLFGGGDGGARGDQKKNYELKKLRDFDNETYKSPYLFTCINSTHYKKMPTYQ